MRDDGTESHRTMYFDFGELLAHLEDGERSLATIPATIWTGRIAYDAGTDIDELNRARCIAIDRGFPVPDSRVPMLVVLTDRRLFIGQAKGGLRRRSGLRRVQAVDHVPNLVMNGSLTVVCLIGYVAFIAGAMGEYLEGCFVVEVDLSNGKSLLLELHGDAESFLSAYRSVSDQHRSTS